MMIAASAWRDVVSVVLGGFVVTNTLHAANHAVDEGGGHASDTWLLLLFSAIAAVGLVIRLRELRTRKTSATISR